jgi:hypothetical protein
MAMSTGTLEYKMYSLQDPILIVPVVSIAAIDKWVTKRYHDIIMCYPGWINTLHHNIDWYHNFHYHPLPTTNFPPSTTCHLVSTIYHQPCTTHREPPATCKPLPHIWHLFNTWLCPAPATLQVSRSSSIVYIWCYIVKWSLEYVPAFKCNWEYKVK